jgi:hypothetical protein
MPGTNALAYFASSPVTKFFNFDGGLGQEIENLNLILVHISMTKMDEIFNEKI